MGVIKDRQTILGTIYERFDGSGTLIQQVGTVGFIKDSQRSKRSYFIVADLRGNLINDANYYLNQTLGDSGFKKRELAFTALKLFYSFLQLQNIDWHVEDLTYDHFKQLVRFLEGGKMDGYSWNLELQTKRSNESINAYLGVYRDYFSKVFGIKDNALFDTATVGIRSGGGLFGHANKKIERKYKSNKKTGVSVITVPKYIKPYQYQAIIEEVDKSFGLREKTIIDLMYKYGLRLGEVLGLTFEDIESTNLGTYQIVIRNRLSDKPYQSAKGVMKVRSLADYEKKSYRTYGVGYQIIMIDDDMVDLISEYIDQSRDPVALNKSYKKR